jgi:predicted Zn-dependent peptidase
MTRGVVRSAGAPRRGARRRRKLGRALAGLVGVLAAAAGTAAAQPSAKPLPADLVPQYARTTLANGLVLLLLEQHEVPVVNFEMLFRSGSIADPAGKEGLADVTMGMLRKGTARHTAEQLAEELDFLGASLDLGAAHERCRIDAQFLAKDVDAGLALLADVVQRPRFDADELEKLIDLSVNGLRDLKETPRVVVEQYYDSFLFGAHPFARPVGGTETSLPAIARGDVESFYRANLHPGNAILAVVGDFRADEMRGKIEAAFSGWARSGGTPAAAAAAAPKAAKGRRVLLVDEPDATQTYFRIGNVGVRRGDPDAAAIDVVNTVFGGRFTSWLMNELRTKSGLSYGANSNFVRRRVPGSFYISSFTRAEDTQKAVDLALSLLERLHASGVTEEELASAKNYIRGQYPPDYEAPGQLAQTIADLEFFGLDRDEINAHTRRTDGVTLADAKRVIAKHYPRKDLTTVMVGPASKVKKMATRYGTLSEKSISAPGF